MDIEKKIRNLDEEKSSLTITISGKDFVISRITLQARQRYGDYLIFCGEYYQKALETNKRAESASETTETLIAIQNEMTNMIESFANEKASMINKLLKIILEKNGYEYSQEWWVENTDYNDMEKFIVAALKKDEVENAQPKKKEMSATSIEQR